MHETFSFIIWKLPNSFTWPYWFKSTWNTTFLHFDHAVWVLKIWPMFKSTAILILICKLMLSCFRINRNSCFWFQNMIESALIYVTFLFKFDFAGRIWIFTCFTHWCGSTWWIFAIFMHVVFIILTKFWSQNIPIIMAVILLNIVYIDKWRSSLLMIICFNT